MLKIKMAVGQHNNIFLRISLPTKIFLTAPQFPIMQDSNKTNPKLILKLVTLAKETSKLTFLIFHIQLLNKKARNMEKEEFKKVKLQLLDQLKKEPEKVVLVK